ncbi:MAG: M14 metallopeptidase family protein [Planctomycetota bacterium]
MRILTLLLLPCLPLAALAEDSPFPYRGDESYEKQVPAPAEFLGVELGGRFTPHHDVVRYLRHLAAESPRARLVEYGRSAEGRELVLLFVSSEGNIARLEEIRERHGLLADPRRREAAGNAPLDDLLEGLPGIAWLSYNVHGNEASSTEAALRTAYQLVDGGDAATRKIRERVVAILDPLLNPDGRERYLHWYQQVAAPGGNPDPGAREHSEPWPGGRSNHYYFDLNRDWAWLSQPETQARVVQYLRWQPLVHVDYHEMSSESSYFYFPPETPFNTNIPKSTLRWCDTFGRANAAAFDRFGWLYYTAEAFDLFYPGYGDTWPSLHGAIGMTYEQAGGGRGGLRYRRAAGDLLTLKDRLHHHFVTSMATLECAADRKEELQQSFHDFRRSATEGGREGDIVEFIFPPEQGERLRHLLRLLMSQGIEVEVTFDQCIAEGLEDYHGKKTDLVKLPPGTYVVPMGQPAGRLARALLEPRAKITENRFYDVAAWSLPLAMGVHAYFASDPINIPKIPFQGVEEPKGHIEGQGGYAYLLEWRDLPAAQALVSLQREGIAVRLIPERIVIEGREHPPGTLLVLLGSEPERVHEAVRAAAAATGVVFYGVHSGWTDEGIDLGSEKIAELAPPRIAVATGRGVSTGSHGAIWSFFERELEIPFTAFDLGRLGSLDLSRYNVIVLPDGHRYRSELSKRVVERLRGWLGEGGVIVAIGGGAFSLTAEQSGLTRVSAKADAGEKPKKPDKKVRRKIEELRRMRRERQVPGSIFRVDLDLDHPLAFGMEEQIHAFMSSTRSFALTGGEGDVGAFTEDPEASGYISEENLEKLRRRLYLAEERVGRGRVVLFAGDPNFRLFWRGLTGLFLNATFLRCRH